MNNSTGTEVNTVREIEMQTIPAVLTIPDAGTPAETEALRAMRESYEAQLKALRDEQAKAREEHAKQIREILMSGRTSAAHTDDQSDDEETEKERIERVARGIANKILTR